MTWNEALHRRNDQGEFSRESVGAWAQKISDEIGRRDPVQAARAAAASGLHPEGHTEARNRHQHLWNIPTPPQRGGQGRERTDAEHDEAVRLDDAFGAYREQLGLVRNPQDRGVRSTFVGEDTREPFNQYGERINRPGGYSKSPSMRHNADRMERRRGESRGRPDNPSGADPVLMRRTPGKAPEEIYGMTLGYGARADWHTSDENIERAKLFVALMKRRQPRARQEMDRQPVRRTPRGTKIENWMQA